MSAVRVHGDVLPDLAVETRITEMRLDFLPIDLIVQWRRCSVTADFFANYLTYHFENRASALHVLSHGLNELVENLAKFAADKQRTVSIVVSHYGDTLRVRTENEALRPQAEALASRLDRMATTDAEDLFLEQLEHTASKDRAASGLGLITIKKDYGAQMAARITPVPERPDHFAIVFTLDLDVETVEQV